MKQSKRTTRPETRGFTAIEITMVVTVIAILALLILPLFRDRVEQARLVAAMDELQTFQKSELLAYADTNYFYRLQDLDNAVTFNSPPLRPHEEVPIAQWNRPFTVEERNKLRAGSNEWKGPYVSINKFKYLELDEALLGYPEFFWSFTGRGGPIMNILIGGAPDWWPDPAVPITADVPEDRILIDPWGTPYLFFGPGRMFEEGGTYLAQETDFGNAAVFSLGPDGMPGQGIPYTGDGSVLMRETGVLGAGDDLWVFM